MKILVFSDTHGDVSLMKDVVSRNRYDTDLVIHLGDHLKDLHDGLSYHCKYRRFG